jgi:hypothetical protein
MFYRWSTLRRIFKYTSPILKALEKPILRKYGQDNPAHPAVFIIGAPRTGSTIFYELVTNIYDVLYISNLNYLGFRNLFFSFWLSNSLFKNKPHNYFASSLGRTFDGGLKAPHEGDRFWYQFIPKGIHYLELEDVKMKKVKKIKRIINAIIHKYNKLFVFKSMPAGLRLKIVKKLFPDAKFIFIKRNPVFVAQSIIKARIKYHGDENSWWSIKPKNYNEIKDDKYYRQVVKQIYYIEKQIEEDKALFPSKNFLTVSYEELVQDLDQTLNKVESFLGYDFKRDNYCIPNLKLSNRIRIDKEIFEKIEKEVQNYDWVNYSTP